ncbi:unnamed protein product [Allacma fusca]|uniref:Uncharacterized protein n=1 Tax=Allacma fusca TaxID=39272 RepID=A0A8J2KJ61_9HEXA|nr:unnamed protein product [Allacma fusca]
MMKFRLLRSCFFVSYFFTRSVKLKPRVKLLIVRYECSSQLSCQRENSADWTKSAEGTSPLSIFLNNNADMDSGTER